MPATQVSIAAVICAAGSSRRMGGVKKEYLPLNGEKPLTVLGAAARAFASCPKIDVIVITFAPDTENGESAARASLPAELLSARKPPVFFVQGGKNRRSSVYNALSFLESFNPSHVLIHDGARPWISRELIEKTIDAVIRHGAVIPVLPLVETPKELSRFPESETEPRRAYTETAFIKRHLRRVELGSAQTPQAFSFPAILGAHEKAREREERDGVEYTDDAEVWGEFQGQVAVISGDPENKKITYTEDLPNQETAKWKTTQRIGLGKDLHRLAPDRKFLLGGVEIPFEKGELGHSDGDVLAHAVIDAFLGASALADIGELYPPSDPVWKDACSLELLKSAWDRVKKEGWRLVNIDCTVTCERPRILPYREQIRLSLAGAMDADPALFFVKGKTNEGMGQLGTGEAVEALAVCLLERTENENRDE